MTDRIVIHDMRFRRHGVLERERTEDQPFAVDVELGLDLRPAGVSDDLAKTATTGPS
jgi:dihydroneopterin aldolase